MALHGGPLRLGHPAKDLRSSAGGGHTDGGAKNPRGPGRAGRRPRAKSSGVGERSGWEAAQSGLSAHLAAYWWEERFSSHKTERA